MSFAHVVLLHQHLLWTSTLDINSQQGLATLIATSRITLTTMSQQALETTGSAAAPSSGPLHRNPSASQAPSLAVPPIEPPRDDLATTGHLRSVNLPCPLSTPPSLTPTANTAAQPKATPASSTSALAAHHPVPHGP